MTPAFSYIVVAVVVFAGCEVLLGLWYQYQAKRYRAIAKTERIRLQIGDARCRLVAAAARGELGHNTATFRDLYFVQTGLMRGTNHYPAICEAFWTTKMLRYEQAHQTEMVREATSWSPEVKAIADQTADAIRQIWIGYVPLGLVVVARVVRIDWRVLSRLLRLKAWNAGTCPCASGRRSCSSRTGS